MAECQVADLFEDEVVFVGEAEQFFALRVSVLSFGCRGVDNAIRDLRVAAIDAKRLVNLALVVLLDQEG